MLFFVVLQANFLLEHFVQRPGMYELLGSDKIRQRRITDKKLGAAKRNRTCPVVWCSVFWVGGKNMKNDLTTYK